MRKFLISMAALLAVVGCAKQEDLVSANFASGPEFGVGIDATRVAVAEDGEAYKLSWTKGDLLSVFYNDGGNSQYRFIGETGDVSGKIVAVEAKQGNDLPNFYAVYPYDESNELNGDVLSFTLPAEQSYEANTFGLGANTMVARTVGEGKYDFAFTNVCGYICLKVYGDVAVKSVELKGNNNEIISGAATYDMTSNELDITGEGKTITLNCAEAVEVGATEAQATAFWFVVPATTFNNGFTVTITDAEGNTMTKKGSKSFTVAKNAVHNSTFEYQGDNVIFNAKFQADGTATDAGKFGLNIQKMTHADVPYQFMSTYTNSTYATPIARYYWTPSDQGGEYYPIQKTGYYLVDFSANAEFKAALADGFTIETVYMEPMTTPNSAVIVGTNAWSIVKSRESTINASYNVNIASTPWDNWGVELGGKRHEVAKFHHAMMVYDAASQEVRLFVDGTLDCEGDAATFDIGERLTIGARSMMRADDNYASAIHHWYGDIAMVKIYDNAFSAEKVKAKYAKVVMPTKTEFTAPQPLFDAKFNADLSIDNIGSLKSAKAELVITNSTNPSNPKAKANVKVESVNGTNVLHFTHEITNHHDYDTSLNEGNSYGQPDGTIYMIDDPNLMEKLNDGDFSVELIVSPGCKENGNYAWSRHNPISSMGFNICYWGDKIEYKLIYGTSSEHLWELSNNIVSPAVGKYHHLVLVPNVLGHTVGQMQAIYNNGAHHFNASSKPVRSTPSFLIGAAIWNGGFISRPFNGHIAAVRVYDHHLGPLEVAALYEKAKPIVEALNAANTPASNAKRVSIIGDSYSTFNGYSNRDIAGNANGFNNMYPYADMDVLKMEDTWWGRLCATEEFDLEVNNSYAGSTICNTAYGNVDMSGRGISYIERIGMNPNGVDYNGNPDIILIFGGTNDAWSNVRMGKYIFSDWGYDDLLCFRAGFAKLITSLREHYPNAELYNISNVHTYDGKPGITKRVAESMAYVCKHYNVPNIQLQLTADPDMQYDHPTAAGMQHIFEQVYAVLTGAAEPTPAPDGEAVLPAPTPLGGTPVVYESTNRKYIEHKTGQVVELRGDASFRATNFVEIPESATHISVSPITVYNGGNGPQSCPIAFYDANKTYIPSGSVTPIAGKTEYATDIIEHPIPENAVYVRFSWTDFPYYHATTNQLVELYGEINAAWITK